jgi:hypothetical protein
MQRGLGGFRRERLHQEGKGEKGKGKIKCVINEDAIFVRVACPQDMVASKIKAVRFV